MRIVIFGAGAVGGVIGGRLFEHRDTHGHDVTLVARGRHHDALRDHGLTLHDKDGATTLPVPVAATIGELPLEPGDVVILTMKTQDTPGALEALTASAPPGVAVVCAQNGVENERLALRVVDDVYGICVILPATMLEPGVVQAHGTPTNAILDVGRYPSGTDATASAVAEALVASGLVSEAVPNIMRAKYRKLLMNLANPLDALVLEGEDTGDLHRRARHEAEACFAAAGIEYATAEEDRARREGVLRVTSLEGRPRGGGSTWQSLVRGSGTTEVDWLNGEVVLLGRLHGVPTPVNAMLQAATRDAARRGTAPRSLKVADLEALIDG